MLAGDVLLTEAFEAIANAPACPQACVQAAKALGLGAGSRGMVYGQELDLKYEALAATEDQLRLIHRNKTGALINAAVQMGAAAAEADTETCRVLEAYAYGLGLVFQIVDDVLDVTSTPEHRQRQRKRQNDLCHSVWCAGCNGPCTKAQRRDLRAAAQPFWHKSGVSGAAGTAAPGAQKLIPRSNHKGR